MPDWSEMALMISSRTRQLNLLQHLAPMWTVVWTEMGKCIVVVPPLADEHLSNDCVEQQGKEQAIPSFPFFSLERHEGTDGNPANFVICFFNKIPHQHYYTVCKMAEDWRGKRVVNNTVCFEFATYDDALQAAQAIDKFLSPRPTKTN